MHDIDLRTWRESSAPESLEARAFANRRLKLKRAPLTMTLGVAAVLAAAFLMQPNPAYAALAKMKARLRQVQTLWIDTESFGPDPGHVGKGITLIAHGAKRRDGLRGLRGYRGPAGRWYYDPKLDKVIEEEDSKPMTVTPANFEIETYISEPNFGARVEDEGEVIVDGSRMHLYKCRFKIGHTDIWVDPETNLPRFIKEYGGNSDALTGTATFRYDVEIDPEVMTPRALATPIKDLIRP